MKRFAFRAQAALDLRKRQEEEARRALALAQGLAQEAREALAAAERRLDDMLQKGRAEDASGDLAAGIWYRNWIVGQRQRIERCRHGLRESEVAVEEAIALARTARRKARSLERFRERALRLYTREEARQEQKVLDELGAARFIAGRHHAGDEI